MAVENWTAVSSTKFGVTRESHLRKSVGGTQSLIAIPGGVLEREGRS